MGVSGVFGYCLALLRRRELESLLALPRVTLGVPEVGRLGPDVVVSMCVGGEIPSEV